MFEHHKQQLISRKQFALRLYKSILLAVAVMAVSLLFGVWGYSYFEHMPTIDALLNASMILGGMGPVDALHEPAAKIFASLYALFSGLMLIALMAIILSPIFHRILHVFHAPDQ